MFRKKDIVIYLLVLLLAGAAYIIPACIRRSRPPASFVRVSIDGRTLAEYPIGEDTETVIDGYRGGSLKLVIRDRQAYVESSSCPDKICVKHAPVSYTGECIICMPNRIMVEIVPAGGDPEIDAVSRIPRHFTGICS